MRILVLSDIHGNADALKTVLESAGRYDYIWVLGDLVDYGPEPHVVVDMIRELKPDIVLMGNHDYAVAYNTDCRCAQELHDLSEYTRREISLKLLSQEQVSWLKTPALNTQRVVDSLRVYLVHASPRSPLHGYLKPSLPVEQVLLALTPNPLAVKPKPVEADLVVIGHTHIPMDLRIEGIRVVNPGSVGQPRNGDWRASYMIIDFESKQINHYRVEYNVEKTIEKLRALGLNPHMQGRLEAILKTGSVGSTVF